MSQTVTLKTSDGASIPAYVARPSGKPKGAMVVIQEIFGVNSHIRSVADGYAQDGYLAVAPCIFHRVQPNVELGYEAADRTAGFALKEKVEALPPQAGAAQDIQSAIDFGAIESGGKVAIVGYCWGGLLSWRAACGLKGLSAAVTYYGGGMTVEAEMSKQPKVSVMSHFAQLDQFIPVAGVEVFRNRHPEVELFIYAADHGFNCDQRASFDATAAKLARERTLSFLAEHLRKI